MFPLKSFLNIWSIRSTRVTACHLFESHVLLIQSPDFHLKFYEVANISVPRNSWNLTSFPRIVEIVPPLRISCSPDTKSLQTSKFSKFRLQVYLPILTQYRWIIHKCLKRFHDNSLKTKLTYEYLPIPTQYEPCEHSIVHEETTATEIYT